MLIGEYRHTLDDKRRISLPAKFRKDLGKKVVITHGLDNCLFIFSLSQWEKVVGKMEQLSMGQSDSRAFGRHLFSGAIDVDIDQLGRVLVPEYLAKKAQLELRAVLIGVHDRVELWNEALWERYKERIEKEADHMAEKLGDIGLL